MEQYFTVPDYGGGGGGLVNMLTGIAQGVGGVGGDPHSDDRSNFDSQIAGQLLSNARATNAPTYAAWYGHVWGVTAQGAFSALGDYLTIGEAAALLGVSIETLRNWDRADKFKPVRHPLNGYRLYRRDDLETLLRQTATGKGEY